VRWGSERREGDEMIYGASSRCVHLPPNAVVNQSGQTWPSACGKLRKEPNKPQPVSFSYKIRKVSGLKNYEVPQNMARHTASLGLGRERGSDLKPPYTRRTIFRPKITTVEAHP
jgi:hypothetical protein